MCRDRVGVPDAARWITLYDDQESLPADVIERWRRAVTAGDADAAAECCRRDVVLISPLTERFRFRGQAEVRDLLHVAFGVISNITVHTALRDGANAALFCTAEVDGRFLEEAQLLRLDTAGLVTEITLFGRPLPALTTLMRQLGPAMAREQGRPLLGTFLAATTAPLDLMARTGERRIVPLAQPRNPTR